MGFSGGEAEPTHSESRISVINEAKKFFKPEFINRLDEIIIFKPLSKHNNRQIARLELEKLSNRLKEKNVYIKYTPKVLDFLVEKGTSIRNGARFLKRAIQKNIEDKISLIILSRKNDNEQILKIVKKGGELVISEI